MDIKEKIKGVPATSGVYLLKDCNSAIIYVGKAASIRKRLTGHFGKGSSSRQQALIDSVSDIDYIITPDESTALLLEAALIKRYNPKYNVALRDDKSYPRLKLTVNEEYPRLFIARKLKDDGALYFGPYTNAKLLRKALAFMKRQFPLRTCTAFAKSVCLNFHLGQCLAPCIDKNKRQEYLSVVEELKLFLNGDNNTLIELLSEQMKIASEKKQYEEAARIRDRIKAFSCLVRGTELPIDTETLLKEKAFIPASQQIEELRAALNLDRPPFIIEAFDVSNITGKEAVGSLVVFKNGKPDTQKYRKFKIKTVKVIDDYSMMREIVSRRFKRLLNEESSLPDLVIIDGGKGHLIAAKQTMHSLGLWKVPVISIAKEFERIYISEEKEPLLLGKFAGALLLVRRIRDEAHRFAIEYHRLLRRKIVGFSELDNIEGIGPKRKSSLIKHFGSLDEVKMADIEDLQKVRFVSEKEAKAIYSYFHQ